MDPARASTLAQKKPAPDTSSLQENAPTERQIDQPKNLPQRHITATPSTPSSSSGELEWVNREMYRRNLELASRNKTLSLLRKFDELILSAVTDVKETAEQVTNLLVRDAEFRIAAIFFLDEKKQNLSLLAFSKPQMLSPDESAQLDRFTMIKTFSVDTKDNLLVQAITEKKVKTTSSLVDVLQTGSLIGVQDAQIIQQVAGIKSALVFPIVIREEVIGTMLVCQDYEVSELNEYQWDLLERLVSMVGIALDNAVLYDKVQVTNQKLKVLDRLKDEFVSLASHELRTPMTAIKSYLWLFLEDNRSHLTDKQRMYIERAYASTDRLINLVNDMLNVSRIESGRLIINKKPVNITQLIAEVANEITPAVNEENLSLSFESSEKQLPLVDADPDKIKQVLLNLLGNSVKFTPPGGRIYIRTELDGEFVIVSIIDTGKGIAQEDMPKLFKKFGTVGSPTIFSHGAQSTGLGLYISKAIVELHGGKIIAKSDGAGKGATFSFSLRISRVNLIEAS